MSFLAHIFSCPFAQSPEQTEALLQQQLSDEKEVASHQNIADDKKIAMESALNAENQLEADKKVQGLTPLVFDQGPEVDEGGLAEKALFYDAKSNIGSENVRNLDTTKENQQQGRRIRSHIQNLLQKNASEDNEAKYRIQKQRAEGVDQKLAEIEASLEKWTSKEKEADLRAQQVALKREKEALGRELTRLVRAQPVVAKKLAGEAKWAEHTRLAEKEALVKNKALAEAQALAEKQAAAEASRLEYARHAEQTRLERDKEFAEAQALAEKNRVDAAQAAEQARLAEENAIVEAEKAKQAEADQAFRMPYLERERKRDEEELAVQRARLAAAKQNLLAKLSARNEQLEEDRKAQLKKAEDEQAEAEKAAAEADKKIAERALDAAAKESVEDRKAAAVKNEPENNIISKIMSKELGYLEKEKAAAKKSWEDRKAFVIKNRLENSTMSNKLGRLVEEEAKKSLKDSKAAVVKNEPEDSFMFDSEKLIARKQQATWQFNVEVEKKAREPKKRVGLDPKMLEEKTKAAMNKLHKEFAAYFQIGGQQKVAEPKQAAQEKPKATATEAGVDTGGALHQKPAAKKPKATATEAGVDTGGALQQKPAAEKPTPVPVKVEIDHSAILKQIAEIQAHREEVALRAQTPPAPPDGSVSISAPGMPPGGPVQPINFHAADGEDVDDNASDSSDLIQF